MTYTQFGGEPPEDVDAALERARVWVASRLQFESWIRQLERGPGIATDINGVEVGDSGHNGDRGRSEAA